MTHFDGAARAVSWDEDGGESSASLFIRDQRTRAIKHYREPVSREHIVVGDRFRSLADQWRAETRFVSSPQQQVANKAYLAIIGLGEAALPFILEDLEQTEDFWSPALAAITGVDPTSRGDWGDMHAIALAWLQWANAHGIRW
jgi:hypothetical protein